MFALIIHELATNATKYGALSTPNGKVAIRWEVKDDAFAFSWVETGGPPVQLPATTGFGTKLIQVAIDAAPTISYSSEGFRYAVVVPVDQIRP